MEPVGTYPSRLERPNPRNVRRSLRWLKTALKWLFLPRFPLLVRVWAGLAFKVFEFFVLIAALIQFSAWSHQREHLAISAGWQTIVGAAGLRGDGGRTEALEDLQQRHVDLRYAPLTRAILANRRLIAIDLRHSQLDSAVVENVNFLCARLDSIDAPYITLSNVTGSHASLTFADLRNAKFEHVILDSADIHAAVLDYATGRLRLHNGNAPDASFDHAFLVGADFRGANLTYAHFDSASLHSSDFTGAHLQGATFTGASLMGAVLDATDLRDVDLDSLQDWDGIVSISGANIARVRNPPSGFVSWAIGRGAVAEESDSVWYRRVHLPIATGAQLRAGTSQRHLQSTICPI